jgi:XTP/dITP diphosphohydrolase
MEDIRLKNFRELLDIMDTLRANCPWDKKQTFESLRYLTIEETYELSDAILEQKYADISKELGDLLLHIVFYSKIGEEKALFSIADVIQGVNEKLIRRHPHIFGDVKVKNEQDVRNNWEVIKLKEGNSSVLGGVPKSLPAMVKAYRMQEKANGVGFDWKFPEDAWKKVREEIEEYHQEYLQNSDEQEEEFGDLLFALINYARLVKINPEDALEKTNRKFIQRFQYMEKKALEMNKTLQTITLNEMEEWWNEAKKKDNHSLTSS